MKHTIRIVLPGIQNNVQWVDWFNVDLDSLKVFDLEWFDLQVYLDVSNTFNHKQLNFAGFADNFDYQNYLTSLKFPLGRRGRKRN